MVKHLLTVLAWLKSTMTGSPLFLAGILLLKVLSPPLVDAECQLQPSPAYMGGLPRTLPRPGCTGPPCQKIIKYGHRPKPWAPAKNSLFFTVSKAVYISAPRRPLFFSSPSVLPAYGYIALALVKCSNEGGPGPIYNRKQDPGSSIFSMLVVYGSYLYLLPLFSEPGDWKDQYGPPPPPSDQPGLRPIPPPWGTYSTTCKDEGEASLGGNHTSASDSRSEAADWARGGCGDHFWAFQLFSRRSGS